MRRTRVYVTFLQQHLPATPVVPDMYTTLVLKCMQRLYPSSKAKRFLYFCDGVIQFFRMFCPSRKGSWSLPVSNTPLSLSLSLSLSLCDRPPSATRVGQVPASAGGLGGPHTPLGGHDERRHGREDEGACGERGAVWHGGRADHHRHAGQGKTRDFAAGEASRTVPQNYLRFGLCVLCAWYVVSPYLLLASDVSYRGRAGPPSRVETPGHNDMMSRLRDARIIVTFMWPRKKTKQGTPVLFFIIIA